MGILWKISKWYNRYQFFMWASGVLTAIAAPLIGYATYFLGINNQRAELVSDSPEYANDITAKHTATVESSASSPSSASCSSSSASPSPSSAGSAKEPKSAAPTKLTKYRRKADAKPKRKNNTTTTGNQTNTSQPHRCPRRDGGCRPGRRRPACRSGRRRRRMPCVRRRWRRTPSAPVSCCL